MTNEQQQAIYGLYYTEGYTVGRDRLYRVMRERGHNVSVRQVRDWLRRQYVAQLYYPTRRIKPMTSTIAKSPGSQVGIDLADLRDMGWKGYKYILTGIDLHSKYAFAVPLKTKTTQVVLAGIQRMIQEATQAGMNVRSVRSDNGSEFIARPVRGWLENQGITQVLSTPGNPRSNGQVERFNGILKGWLRRRMKAENSKDWVNMLPSTLRVYNTTQQETIKMSPIHALTANTQETTEKIRKRVLKAQPTPQHKVGDTVRVRIRFTKDTDKPMDGILWSPRVFEVSQVRKSHKPWIATRYRLKNQQGDYFGEELQPIEGVENIRNEPERYDISRLVRPSVHQGEPGYIVAWRGYRKASDNTWEPRSSLIETSAGIVEAFDDKKNVRWYEKDDGGWGFEWGGNVVGV